MNAGPVAELQHIAVDYRGDDGRTVHAVQDVSLTIAAGESVALVGESGSGKTTISRVLLGLVAPTRGTVRVTANVQAVFQDPLNALTPHLSIGYAIREVLAVRRLASGPAATARVAELLAAVGLPADAATRHPGELSGGERQRAAIARALAAEPALLVLDEPVASLDTVVQAQVLTLLDQLRRERSIAYLFIAHDLGVVARIAERVAVLYDGQIVEEGPTLDVLGTPHHPFTAALRAAIPELP